MLKGIWQRCRDLKGTVALDGFRQFVPYRMTKFEFMVFGFFYGFWIFGSYLNAFCVLRENAKNIKHMVKYGGRSPKFIWAPCYVLIG